MKSEELKKEEIENLKTDAEEVLKNSESISGGEKKPTESESESEDSWCGQSCFLVCSNGIA